MAWGFISDCDQKEFIENLRGWVGGTQARRMPSMHLTFTLEVSWWLLRTEQGS